ncbi:ribonuclease VapC [Clostridia bacterium]|nr:ribonuclease VapC [Clostridia bacterium]
MNVKAFADTNILVYYASLENLEKLHISREYISNYYTIISTQTLNEFCNVLLRKKKLPLADVKKSLEIFVNMCEVVKLELNDISYALNLSERYNYSYYDCLMLASAINSDCKFIFTEDMQDGQIIDNKLTIKNIYRE